ncbi:N-formylglutamate amidohydrolase [Roseateles sp.]|uniref:N-formylglutamate amidohydrolase n=1 Tax=Roseateles sp. TaxID=1971397 RepID=UPI003BA6B498
MDHLLWIESGRRFAPAELMHWQGSASLQARAASVDTLVLGPHASAAFPAELRPFINPALTRRQQCDFSDCTTAVLGRLWAQADAGVIYIENPHARLALDANRAPPPHWLADLQEFFRRLRLQQSGQTQSFSGIDAIRPISFSGMPVLLEPQNAEEWTALADALSQCISQGIAVYRQACEQVLRTVMAARPGKPVRVISLHDTMNTQMREDGALLQPRPAADQLPAWVNFGTLADEQGEVVDEAHPPSYPGASARQLLRLWSENLGAEPSDFSLNRPYKGAYETRHFAELLRAHGAPHSGAIQVEFRREALLGEAATACLQKAGEDWPEPELPHLQKIAQALAEAGRELRQMEVMPG